MNIFKFIFNRKPKPAEQVASNEEATKTPKLEPFFGSADHIHNLESMWEKTVPLPIPDARDLLAAEIFKKAAKRRSPPVNGNHLKWLKENYPALDWGILNFDYMNLSTNPADLIWDEFPKIRAAFELSELSKSQGSLLSLIEDDLEDDEGGKAPSPVVSEGATKLEDDEEEEYPLPKF